MIHIDRDAILTHIEVTNDGKKLLGSTYPNNNIQIWDTVSGRQLSSINTLREYKTRDVFWRASQDYSKIYCWIETKGASNRIREGNKSGVEISFPDSRIEVWTIEGKMIRAIKNQPTTKFVGLRSSPDGRYLISSEEPSGKFFGKRPTINRIFDIEASKWEKFKHVDMFEFSADSKLIAACDKNHLNQYTTGFSINRFPAMKLVRKIKFAKGLHRISSFQFLDDQKHIIVAYRTYDHKNTWNRWEMTLACYEINSGRKISSWKSPYANDSPTLALRQLSNGLLLLTTQQKKSKEVIALTTPDLKQKWNIELGECQYCNRIVTAPGGKWFAVVLQSKFFPGVRRGSIDWDLVPQNKMFVIDDQGRLLEKMIVPIGSKKLVFHPGTEKKAFLSAAGSVYKVDFSRPFNNEKQDGF